MLAAPVQAKDKAKRKWPPGQEVDYATTKTKLKGYLVRAARLKGLARRPGVLVVHEWWGHNDYVRMRARLLARLGYTAFAVDMFGDGKNTTHPKTAQKFAAEAQRNAAEAKARFDAAYALLAKEPSVDPKRIVAIGYCFGGTVVLNMARQGAQLAAVASFHGGLSTAHPAKRGVIKGKVLVFSGGADPMVPASQVASFKQEMKAAGVKPLVISYPGAKHAFSNPDADLRAADMGGANAPIGYNAAADQRSWTKFTSVLRRL